MHLTRRTLLQGAGASLALTGLAPRAIWASTQVQFGTMQVQTLSDGYLTLPGDLLFAPMPQDELEGNTWWRRACETLIELGVDVEASNARLVAIDAQISQLTGGAVPSGDDDGQEAALRRRAEVGDAEAGWTLGQTLMARGEEAEAVKWMRWAAEEKAFTGAMGLLGSWYIEGKGVPQDELEGYKWARRAYETKIERGINVEDS